MAFGRLIDTIKKKKQQEMEEKYPAQNLRTAVSTVVTRKETPQWAAKSSGQVAISAVNRDMNAHKKVENYPLKAEKKKSARKDTELKTTRDPDFVWRAAEGWKSFQTDEKKRSIRDMDSGFQRWKAQGGVEETVDWTYKPQKNWSVDENNTFGYLYGKDKQQAYGFAKNLNDLLNKRFDNIGSALEEGARGQAEKAAKLSAEAWSTHTKAQEANSTAQRRSADINGDVWKSIGNGIKTGVQTDAQVQIAQGAQAQEQGRVLNEMTQNVMKRFGESMQSYGEALKVQADRQKEAQILAGKYSGVTGSDQTGASVHGYREDTSYKEPNDEWTSGERQLYEYHLKNNPEEAEKYAIRVNDRHNQQKKNEKLQAIDDWTSENAGHGALAWSGARGLNLGAGIDGYNQQLELAGRGRVTVNPDLSMTDIVTEVDDTNERNIAEKIGAGAGLAYRVVTDAADSLISRGMNFAPVAKLPSGDKIRIHDVNEAVKAFNEGYLGARNNENGVLEGVLTGVANAGLGFVVGNKVEEGLKKVTKNNPLAATIEAEGIMAVGKNIVSVGSEKWFEQNQTEIERRKKNYMQEKGVTERKAWWMATKELIEKSLK